MKSVLVIKGEEVYNQNKAELEKAHEGKIVAIETDYGSPGYVTYLVQISHLT